MWGKITIDQIEGGVREHVRYASVNFGTFISPTNVHSRENTSMLGVVAHDRYHQVVTSVTPSFIHAAKLLLCEQIRADFGIKWSREIWAMIDGDSTYPLRPGITAYREAGIALLVWMEDLAVSRYNRVAGDGILVSSNSNSCGRYTAIGTSKTTILGKWLLLKLCFDRTFAENLNMSFDTVRTYSDDIHSYYSQKGSTLRWKALMKTCREIQGFKENITGFAELPLIMQLLHFSYPSGDVLAKHDAIMAEGNTWFVKPTGKGRFKNTIQLNMGLCVRILGRPLEQLQLGAYLPAIYTDAATPSPI